VCEKSKRREMEGVGYWRETRRSERGRDGAVEWGRREKKGRRCVRNREEEKERGVGCGRKERRKKRIEKKGEGETIERERERERNEGLCDNHVVVLCRRLCLISIRPDYESVP
jgi:hypothetical protein